MKFNIKNLIRGMFLIIYKIILDIVYCKGVIPYYAYQGFVYSFSLKCLVLSYVITIILAVVINKLLSDLKFSNIVVLLLIILYYIPATTIITFTANNMTFLFLITLYFSLLLFFNKLININILKFKIKEKKIDWLLLVTVLLSIMMLVISGVYSRFNISFDLSEYYELRFSARELSMPTIIRYLFNWARYIIPIGMVYTLLQKKYGFAIFLSFAQMLSFSFNGKKSSLLLFFLAYIIVYFFNEKIWKKVPYIFSGLGVVALLDSIKNGINAPVVKYIIRRVMMVPAHLGYIYFDYFSKHEIDYLRSSTLRHFGFSSPYVSVPRLIGSLYFSNNSLVEHNANTGMFGDAFANFGWFGCILYPLLIILALKVLESCIKNFNSKIIAITSITVAYMFLNGAFFKILLTNGYIVICLLFLLNKSNIEKIE